MSVRLVNVSMFLADQRHAEMRNKANIQAKQANWSHYVSDVPCAPEVKVFAEEIHKAMPNVKLLPMDTEYVNVPVYDDAGVFQTSHNIRVFNEFAVYLDEFPFDIGRISYKDHGARKKDVKSYGVYSRKIRNAKYATHRDQHHMVTATDVKKAMKNVSKYFMPYTTKELAQAFYEPIRINVAKAGESLLRELRTKVDPVVHNYEEIAREIAYLKQQGVQFRSSKFQQVADEMADVVERFEAEQNRSTGAIFVRMYDVGGEPYFSIQQVIEVKKHAHAMQSSVENVIEGKPLSEMPEDIAGAVSVLSILNNDQYVANIGMKLNDKHFWIERG